MSESGGTGCWIAIGANQGDVARAFRAVWQRLGSTLTVTPGIRSGLYQTQPIGALAGGTFTNAVFSVQTSLTPLDLLDLLQNLENELGRQRDVRWGPRVLDLDLIACGDQVLQTPRLTLPHPAAWYRRFVLDPLVEVAPDWKHPLLPSTATALQERLSRRPLTVAGWPDVDPEVSRAFPQIRFVSDLAGEQADLEQANIDQADLGLWLDPDAPAPPMLGGIPIADLSHTPGDVARRVTDFLNSVLDQPVRIGDWPTNH